ncbi:MAG: hypothetical protein ABIG61_07185 [Planctomycetota bacterium]
MTGRSKKTVPVRLYIRGQFFRSENISEWSYKFGSFKIQLIECVHDRRREQFFNFKMDKYGDFVCNDPNAGVLFQDSLSLLPVRQPHKKKLQIPAHDKMIAEIARLRLKFGF